MKTCNKCGESNAEDAAKCFYCGAALARTTGAGAPAVEEEAYTVGLSFVDVRGQVPVVVEFANRNQLVDYLGFEYKYHLVAFVRRGGQQLSRSEVDRIQADAAFVSLMQNLAGVYGISIAEAMERFSVKPNYTPYEQYHELP
jgi:hypothetical protein